MQADSACKLKLVTTGAKVLERLDSFRGGGISFKLAQVGRRVGEYRSVGVAVGPTPNPNPNPDASPSRTPNRSPSPNPNPDPDPAPYP